MKPFDPFKELPKTRKEFGQAMKIQGDNILNVAERAGSIAGFGVPADYLQKTVGLTDPVKCIELLWRSLPYDKFRIWLDGRKGVFVVETYPPDPPVRRAGNGSGLILPPPAPKVIANA